MECVEPVVLMVTFTSCGIGFSFKLL